MDQITENPFIEGSEEVSAEEVLAAAMMLAEEAKQARLRASKIREKLYRAKAAKEKAARERAAKEQAAIEASRAQVLRTLANIPVKPSLRPKVPALVANFSKMSHEKHKAYGTSERNNASPLTIDFGIA